MKNADTTNLLTLIESADEHGRVCFHVRNSEPVRNKDEAREYLLTVFMHNAPVTLRLDRVKKAITEIDLVLAQVDATHTALSVNLAKLLQLPGIAPAEELAAYREMVLEMRTFYEAHPTESCSIQVCNNRDRNGRVFGSIACRVPSKTEEHRAVPDVAATNALNSRIQGNQALSHWLRQLAMSLQKIGPWSWAIIREENLFGYSAGPYAKHVWQQVLAEAKAPKAAQDQTNPPELQPLDI